MKPNNPITWIVLFVLTVGLFFMADYTGGKDMTVEEAIVVHKTFAPSGVYHPVKSPPDHYVLVAIQSDLQRGYFLSVSREMFYDAQPQDRLLIGKKYGWITGWEYSQELLTK